MRARGVSTAAWLLDYPGVSMEPASAHPVFHFIEHAIVVIGCDQIACVHLFTPTIRQWSHGAAMAVRFLAESESFRRIRLKSS